MIANKEFLLEWVNFRMDDILKKPEMWGGQEAVEMQILLLLEMDWAILYQYGCGERRLLDRYDRFLRRRRPNGPFPASAQSLSWGELTDLLKDFRRSLKESHAEDA